MKTNSHTQMTLDAMKAFFDGKMSEDELLGLLKTAEEDGKVDAQEKAVLVNVVGKLNSNELSSKLRRSLQSFGRRYSIDFEL